MRRWIRAEWSVNIWLVILAAGVMLLGAGLGEGALNVLRHILPGNVLDDISLRFAGKIVQGLVILGFGTLLIVLALWQLHRSRYGITLSLVEQQSTGPVVINPITRQGLPNVTVFSGHMGLLIVLNALSDSAGRLVAVPAVGSDYRTIGRLVRTSHPDARVLFATAQNVDLCARLSNGEVVVGASEIERDLGDTISDLFLASEGSNSEETSAWPVTQDLEAAVDSSDMIVFGPGSFFTSVIPSLLVPRLRDRIAGSKAATVFICSIMTEPGRTDGWTVGDYIARFRDFAGFAPQYTVVNRSYPGSNILNRYEVTGSFPIMVTPEEHIDASKVVLGGSFPGSTILTIGGSTVIEADIIDVINETRLTLDPERGTSTEETVTVIRHDSAKLARALRGIITQTRSHVLAG